MAAVGEHRAMPAYLDMARSVYTAITGYLRDYEGAATLQDSIKDVFEYGFVTKVDLALLVLFAAAWTVVRYVATNYGFKPWGRWANLPKKEQEKMPESAWKVLFYSMSWLYTSHLLLGKGYTFFQDPASVWTGWHKGMSIPTDIYALYLVQCSFYLHSIYAVLYMDAWRKDSVVMLIHHILTLSLIGFSYIFRYHNIGVLVIWLHDITDIFLECTKVNVYFKNRGGKYHAMNDHLSNFGCGMFGLTWFVFRLYWFPLKVLYSTGHLSRIYVPYLPFYLFFNVLLWVLLVMNVYWFSFIMLFLFRVLTGQMSSVDDIREDDIETKPKKTGSKETPLMNGSPKVKNGPNGPLENGNAKQDNHSHDETKNNVIKRQRPKATME
ncbi:ceramide synthase 1-like [Branchiostoma floridae]|uniref:Ceramide synthase 1-like n=1 Tax=Branchiostoma floridae TaxID=7739 RepID=A0A9J7KT91_BRAFL|nr:ceramide synthase 1-like [Branchiostoma floridae]